MPSVSSPRKQLLDIVLRVLTFRNVTFLMLDISPYLNFCFYSTLGVVRREVSRGSPWTGPWVVREPGP